MKIILMTMLVIICIYVAICGILFFVQEKLIFFPEKLDKQYQFEFNQSFEEINIKTEDNILLNGLLFKAENSKGLIFYLHGNAGALNSWGEIADTYTNLNYDVFILDYRGYGKSEGKISSQKQIYKDIQTVYNQLKADYDENKIIVLGYSIGSGPATKLASTNNPKMLILQAPYFSLTDMLKHNFRIIPAFILKYKFETNKYIKDCKMPIVLFHGNKDEVIYYKSSVKLQKLLKESDIFITLLGQGHNGITDNPKYLIELKKIL